MDVDFLEKRMSSSSPDYEARRKLWSCRTMKKQIQNEPQMTLFVAIQFLVIVGSVVFQSHKSKAEKKYDEEGLVIRSPLTCQSCHFHKASWDKKNREKHSCPRPCVSLERCPTSYAPGHTDEKKKASPKKVVVNKKEAKKNCQFSSPPTWKDFKESDSSQTQKRKSGPKDTPGALDAIMKKAKKYLQETGSLNNSESDGDDYPSQNSEEDDILTPVLDPLPGYEKPGVDQWKERIGQERLEGLSSRFEAFLVNYNQLNLRLMEIEEFIASFWNPVKSESNKTVN